MIDHFKPWRWFTGEWQQLAFALCMALLEGAPWKYFPWWYTCAIFLWWKLYR